MKLSQIRRKIEVCLREIILTKGKKQIIQHTCIGQGKFVIANKVIIATVEFAK
jgi:hypothetical protein